MYWNSLKEKPVEYTSMQNTLIVLLWFAVNWKACVISENWDYTSVTERHSLYHGQTSGQWLTVSSLIPYTTYYVQVNASNSKGFRLSNNMRAIMPMGCEYHTSISFSLSWAVSTTLLSHSPYHGLCVPHFYFNLPIMGCESHTSASFSLSWAVSHTRISQSPYHGMWVTHLYLNLPIMGCEYHTSISISQSWAVSITLLSQYPYHGLWIGQDERRGSVHLH